MTIVSEIVVIKNENEENIYDLYFRTWGLQTDISICKI